MATSKDNEVLIAPDGAVAVQTQPFRPDETSTRPNPVALEVPVSVNGARTVEGSDKREPFSETTKTVLVFGNGAVIRLSSPVAAGQLLFLTNEKTKKEVVCQVVKSKNYRNVSGYVELEFTESVVGFWGMRFPSDRVAAPSASPSGTAIPAAPKGPVAPPAPKVVPPAASAPAKPTGTAPAAVPVAPKPVAPAAPHVEAKPAAPIAAQIQQPTASVPPPAKPPQAPAHTAPTIAASLASSVASLLSSPEVPPAAASSKPVAAPPQPSNVRPIKTAEESSTEELRQQAARLQEQLSSMLFSATPAKPAAPAASPVADAKPTGTASIVAKVLEIAKSDAAPAPPVKPVTVAKPAPPPVKSSLDTEEVKIPSWLEPLARNAAAPTSTQELVEREKARHAAEMAAHEEIKPEPLAAAPPEPTPAEPELPSIGNLLPLDEAATTEQPASGSSRKGWWIGVAAAVVVAAVGGGWYFTHPTSALKVTSPATHAANPPANSTTPALPSAQPTAQNTLTTAPAPAKAAETERASSAPSKPIANSQPAPAVRDSTRNAATTIPAASTERIARTAAVSAPAQPEVKKPSLGDVHLASPTLNHSANTQDDGGAAPTMAGPDADGTNLNSGLVPGAAKQPAAPAVPLPVGGDVKPAKLLSTVGPIYPEMAKAQHISGNVTVDALIDASGKVTTMKVLSGPALLRQAAMDALRQWKYQPATLDGKAVPMHLNVTVQFRMQ
jgi:TonB family protein